MSARLRVLVADDEPPARALLREFLVAHPEVELVAEAADGLAALRLAAEADVQVALLDVQMPGLGGLEVAAGLPPGVAVVFTTAHDAHALRAFELHAVDYLLKPFTAARLAQALGRAVARVGAAAAAVPPALTAAARPPGHFAQRLVVRDGGHVHVVEVDALDCARAQGDYVELVAGARLYLKQQTLQDLERSLDPERFVRAHRTCLVALRCVAAIVPEGAHHVVLLHGGLRLPLSRAGRQRLEARLGR